MERSRLNHVFQVGPITLGYIVTGLPAFATAFAVTWSVLYDFEGATSTHCKVYNFLPSISAAIGRTPQRFVWRFCIALHTTPRFMIALAYLGWHKKVYIGDPQLSYSVLTFLASALHILENTALLLLTTVSSSENNSIHEGSFILFIITSWTYMLVTILLSKWRLQDQGWKTDREALRSYKYKKICAFINISAFITATYLYFRHNWYCESLVYSYFALCEYITIYSNIAYHGTGVLDFKDYSRTNEFGEAIKGKLSKSI